jgi:large subunit ribosomal protein L2
MINLIFEFKYNKIKLNFLKNLLISKQSINGRNNKGIKIYGDRGNRKNMIKYRLIDFSRLLLDIPGFIIKFEFDPNRSVYIMLINYLNGFFTYLLTVFKIKLNSFIINSFLKIKLFLGSSLNLFYFPVGSFISNLQKISLSAGTFCILLKKIGSMILVKLPSKEERFFFSNIFVTFGRLSCELNKLRKFKKAGFYKKIGFKPKVRGVSKNPIDHPHGGGEGKSSEGQPSVTPWGIYTKGVRTTSRFNSGNVKLNLFFYKRRNGVFW